MIAAGAGGVEGSGAGVPFFLAMLKAVARAFTIAAAMGSLYPSSPAVRIAVTEDAD
jgi:hypothetical protein